MKLSLILAPLIAAKVSHEVIMETVLAFEDQQNDALEKRRANDRERQARKRLSREVTGSHAVSRSRTRAEDNTSNNNTSGKKEDTSPPARSRGTRIPDDFSPDIDAATSEGLSRADAEREARSFVDYWRARPGKEALKMDWPATWRVWFRRRLETPKSTAPPRKLTQGESIRNMAREKGVIDDTGSPVRRLEASHRDGENPGTGDVIRLAVAGNHRW